MSENFDWDVMRSRTPGAGSAFIHLNHASTSLPDDGTLKEQERYLQLEREMGAHRAAERIKCQLESVQEAIGRLISAEPHQVALQASASRGFATALSAVAPGNAIEVFVTPYEWAANLMCIESTARARLSVVHQNGRSWKESFLLALDSRDRGRVPVVSLPIVSTTGAFIPALKEVCEALRDTGAWLFIDAGQAVGKNLVDFRSLGADVLYFPGRKWLRGPKGVAAAVFSERALEEFGAPAAPDILGSQWISDHRGDQLQHRSGAARFQTYDHSPALHLGLLAAVQCHMDFSVSATELRIAERSRLLKELVRSLRDIDLLPDTAPGFVCLRAKRPGGLTAEQLGATLWQNGVNVGVVSSHYAPLQLAGTESLLRLTPHAFTTVDEMGSAVSLLHAAIENHLSTT